MSKSKSQLKTIFHRFLGIPDYRSEGVGLYQRSNHKPVQVS
jgi:hypothetical protein